MKPYYEADGITIYHGDSREVMPALGGVDLVITSPPYNLGTSTGGGMHQGSLAASDLTGGYTGYDDAMPQAEYDAWQTEAVALMWSCLSDAGAIAYNHKPRIQGGEVKLPTDYGKGLPLRQIITWDRGTGMNFSLSFFLPKSEWICLWAKPGWRLRDRSCSQLGDVWRVAPEQAGDHPAPFPLELPTRLIGAAAPRLVLDPFMGSGTTLVAAKAAGVAAVGIERSERYCEVATRRLAQGVLFGATA